MMIDLVVHHHLDRSDATIEADIENLILRWLSIAWYVSIAISHLQCDASWPMNEVWVEAARHTQPETLREG